MGMDIQSEQHSSRHICIPLTLRIIGRAIKDLLVAAEVFPQSHRPALGGSDVVVGVLQVKNGGGEVLVVLPVHEHGNAQLPQIGLTDNLLRVALYGQSHREQDGDQNCDDGQDDEEFDEREAPNNLLPCHDRFLCVFGGGAKSARLKWNRSKSASPEICSKSSLRPGDVGVMATEANAPP